jgi:nitroreductase
MKQNLPTTRREFVKIGWIRPRVLAKIVGWPTSVWPVVVITVGYASDAEPAQPPASRRGPLAELVRWV